MDSYADFPGADTHDGDQLPGDQPSNEAAAFMRAPHFTAAAYYDQARSRTYACCFSLENSDYIWTHYGSGDAKGKICVVFDFTRLRERLNASLDPATARLVCENGITCHQIFNVNYGIVQYVDRQQHRANDQHLPNPVQYAFTKDIAFSQERELRIALSALGIGHFVLDDGSTLEFPPNLQAPLDFRAAIAEGTISQILCALHADRTYFQGELARLGIHPADGSDV